MVEHAQELAHWGCHLDLELGDSHNQAGAIVVHVPPAHLVALQLLLDVASSQGCSSACKHTSSIDELTECRHGRQPNIMHLKTGLQGVVWRCHAAGSAVMLQLLL